MCPEYCMVYIYTKKIIYLKFKCTLVFFFFLFAKSVNCTSLYLKIEFQWAYNKI